jgi:hypothetical protein
MVGTVIAASRAVESLRGRIAHQAIQVSQMVSTLSVRHFDVAECQHVAPELPTITMQAARKRMRKGIRLQGYRTIG